VTPVAVLLLVVFPFQLVRSMLCVGRGSWLKWELLLAGTPTLWHARLIVVTFGSLARASQQVSQNPLAPQSGPSTLSDICFGRGGADNGRKLMYRRGGASAGKRADDSGNRGHSQPLWELNGEWLLGVLSSMAVAEGRWASNRSQRTKQVGN